MAGITLEFLMPRMLCISIYMYIYVYIIVDLDNTKVLVPVIVRVTKVEEVFVR